MIAGILAIVAALIGFFASKKSGAKDGTAAAVGLAAGAGTYWTATQTDWGKAQVERIDGWFRPATLPDGSVITDSHGDPVELPPGTSVNQAGQIIDSTGRVIGALNNSGVVTDNKGNVVQSITDLLKDWGPAGTAGVIGGTIAASKLKIEPWMVLAGLGVLALVIVK